MNMGSKHESDQHEFKSQPFHLLPVGALGGGNPFLSLSFIINKREHNIYCAVKSLMLCRAYAEHLKIGQHCGLSILADCLVF